MDAAPPPPPPEANRYRITSETTRVDVVLRPSPGQSSELVVRLAVTEFHTWQGIGGALPSVQQIRPPRNIAGEASMLLSTSSPDCLLDPVVCRRLIREMAKRALAKEYNYFDSADWDAVFSWGVEARVVVELLILSGRRRAGCTFVVYVDIRVSIDLLYCEAYALLGACVLAGRRENGGGTGHLDGGGTAPPQCAICFEEMADEAKATRLPECAHGFHHRCIGTWFKKASTCPMCRRDKIQFLPPEYRAVRDKIKRPNPEGSG